MRSCYKNKTSSGQIVAAHPVNAKALRTFVLILRRWHAAIVVLSFWDGTDILRPEHTVVEGVIVLPFALLDNWFIGYCGRFHNHFDDLAFDNLVTQRVHLATLLKPSPHTTLCHVTLLRNQGDFLIVILRLGVNLLVLSNLL